MDAEEKRELLRAQALIKEKRYAEARVILQAMPFSDTAEKWLEKLNQVVTASPGITAQAAATPPDDLKPWSPRWMLGARAFLAVGLIFGLVMVGYFALNWKRLGKPEWVLETFLAGVLLTIGLVGSIGLILAEVVSPQLGGFAALAFAYTTGVYAMTLSDLQTAPYEKWKRGGVPAMMQHQYDFGKKFLQSGALVVLPLIFIGGGLFYASIPKGYENEYIQFEYPKSWKTYAPDHARYCRDDPNYGCFLTLAAESPVEFRGTALVFAAWPSSNPQGEVQSVAQQIINNPANTFLGTEDITISGRAGKVVDFYAYGAVADQPPYYITIYLIPSDTHVIEINTSTQSEDAHAGIRDDIREVLAELVVK